jgi:hypothetical protein
LRPAWPPLGFLAKGLLAGLSRDCAALYEEPAPGFFVSAFGFLSFPLDMKSPSFPVVFGPTFFPRVLTLLVLHRIRNGSGFCAWFLDYFGRERRTLRRTNARFA